MATPDVNINFTLLGEAFRKFIREKAKRSGSTIIYKENDQLIEEDPTTFKKKVLKQYSHYSL